MEASMKIDYEKKKMAPKEKVKKEMMMDMVGEADESLDDEEDYEKVKKPAVSGAGAGGGSGKKGPGNGGGTTTATTAAMRSCQAEKCAADLTDAKQYHRRHKVCEYHAKSQVALVAGFRQRFCQQCSRFHELSEFDDTKRSCRRRLAGHNERRRKTSADSHAAEGSSRKGTDTHLKEFVCGQVDDRGRIQISIQENTTYKHFQIR